MTSNTLYPCIWFNGTAQEAANYYCGIFPESAILEDTPMVCTFSLNGTKIMGLNGGDKYKVNGAVSLYVYFGNENELNSCYRKLTENGSVLMPLASYAWSERYAWIIDRFGVHWQLDVADVAKGQKIVPALLFGNENALRVKEAVAFYTHIFKPSHTFHTAPYPEHSGVPRETLLFAQIQIRGLRINLMSSNDPTGFGFTPGNSLVVECADQNEIDYFWENLGKGGRYDMCGWLTDKFGLSWQIVPEILPKLMADPIKGPRVVEAFLNMQKFDIEKLLNA